MHISDAIHSDVEGKGKDKIPILKGKLAKAEKIAKDKKKMVTKSNLSDGSEFAHPATVNDIISISVDDSSEALESDSNHNTTCAKQC